MQFAFYAIIVRVVLICNLRQERKEIEITMKKFPQIKRKGFGEPLAERLIMLETMFLLYETPVTK